MTSTPAPMCLFCRHIRGYKEDGRRPACAAFPGGILGAIWENKLDHRQPIDGDHGLQFEAKTADGNRYVTEMMDTLKR